MDHRPYKLITTPDPDRTLGQGHKRHYNTFLEAVNAFMKSDATYKTILFDNGCEARELDEREERLLEHVAAMFNHDIEEVGTR